MNEINKIRAEIMEKTGINIEPDDPLFVAVLALQYSQSGPIGNLMAAAKAVNEAAKSTGEMRGIVHEIAEALKETKKLRTQAIAPMRILNSVYAFTIGVITGAVLLGLVVFFTSHVGLSF